jgi:two-component sensor histidine kinase
VTSGVIAALGTSIGPARNSRWVAWLYGAMVALTLGIATINFVVDYQRTRHDLEKRAEAYSFSMATDVRWFVDVARQTLRRVVANLDTVASTDYNLVIANALSDLPAGVVVGIYDAAGRSQAFVGLDSRQVDISDRSYFQELAGGSEWAISQLLSDRVTGTKTFAVGLALKRNGIFDGAVVAYAPMQVFSEAWLSVGGRQSNAFIVHKGGWLTARLPAIDSEVYDERASPEFVASFMHGTSGSYWAEESPIDGIARVLGYAHVPSTPLIAVIGVSPHEELSAFWRRVGMTLAILAPLLLLLGLASRRIRRLINRQEETAQQLSKALTTNEKFLLEIHHRVKNNLQSALSLIRMKVKSPEIVAEIEPRILAMVTVHEHIYQSEHLVSVSARKYLSDIAQKIIYASANNITLTTDIADIDLPSDVVMPVGQLLNEAVINAVKYGFPDGSEGKINVSFTATEAGDATLIIHNDGAPMPATRRTGLGSRLMPAFAAQVGGKVETVSDEHGVSVIFNFPLAGMQQT